MLKLNETQFTFLSACIALLKDHPEFFEDIEDRCSKMNIQIRVGKESFDGINDYLWQVHDSGNVKTKGN